MDVLEGHCARVLGMDVDGGEPRRALAVSVAVVVLVVRLLLLVRLLMMLLLLVLLLVLLVLLVCLVSVCWVPEKKAMGKKRKK